jgi:hypothetical protein
MFHALLTVLRNTILRTLPLSAVGWLGVELLWGTARGRITYWEDAGLRFLAVWSVAIFWSFPADRGVRNPIPAVYVSLFVLGVLVWLLVTGIRAVRRRRRAP